MLVGICNSQDIIWAKFFWSFIAIRKPVNVDVVISKSDSPWDVVRNNRLIRQFLDDDYDYFIKMDTDQEYPSNYFEKLLSLVEQYKVVGPIIHDRWQSSNFRPLLFQNGTYKTLKWEPLGDKKGVVEVPYSHTNLIYSREVLESISPPWYEAHLREDGLDRANHVDCTFLQKIKDAGYKLYIDTDTVVGHIAVNSIDREFYERWNR